MSSPFEYREIMKAAMQYGTTETVDEVVERHRKTHEAAQQEARVGRKGRKAGSAPAPNGSAKPKTSEMDKVLALLKNAPRRPAPLSEVESPPDE